MPFLTPIKPLVLKIGWNSAEIVPKLSAVPILFLAGARDELVPHDHMRQLLRLAEASGNIFVRMHVIPDGTHNESWNRGGPAYWDAMRNFMVGAKKAIGSTAEAKQREATTVTTSSSAAAAGSSSEDVQSSIPIMSSRFVDIAREAVGVHAQNSNRDQKKEL